MFEYFKQAKRLEIKALEKLEAARALPEAFAGKRADFTKALTTKADKSGLAVIAEYKRASPSQGNISLGLTPFQAVMEYYRGGAAAISVLTEKSKFKGRLNFLQKAWEGGGELFGLPLLRKDFVFHPLQVRASASTPASALLLIVKLTPSAQELKTLREQAESFGLQCVVEILDEHDLDLARASGAKIIQANARDFSDLSVSLERSLTLARKHAHESDELWIAASGFSRPEELLSAKEAGFTAVLAGTALMSAEKPGDALKQWTSFLSASQKSSGVLK